MNNNMGKIVGKIITKIVIVIVFIIVVVCLYVYIWFKVGINDLKKQHNENIEIELQNRDNNIIIFNEYIKSTYGILSEKFEVEIKPDVVSTDTDFDIKTGIMDKTFRIIVDTDNKKIYRDNFYEVLIRDDKFQHLYSDWVKKQVGIDDENVELEFKGALKSARWVGDKPYIDFSNINTLDNLEEQICKNTHNLYLHTVVMNNFKSSNATDVLEVVKEYERLLKPYIFNGGDNILVFGVELNELINDKNDPFSYDILFNYNTNEKRYFKYYKNRPLENNKSEFIYFE